MQKKCSSCKQYKVVTCFNKNRVKKDGLQTYCRECGKKKHRVYYVSNHTKQKKQVYEANRRRIRTNQQLMLNYLSNQACADCGETNPVTFQFDHVRNDKHDHVSTMLLTGYSWKRIQEEISKCDIVCANCHQIRTFIRAGSYRIQP